MLGHFDFPPVVHGQVNEGLGMSMYPMSLVEKSRASCPGGRFPPSFIYQEIIHCHPKLVIRLCVFALKMALDADRA